MAQAKKLGAKHLGQPVDIADEDSVVALFASVAEKLGKVDVLVNNAAIADTFKPAFDQAPDDIERLLEINLTGAFVCTREALRAMPRGGVVVNLGSINTLLPFAPRHAYGASKAGIDILTRCMAAELGPSGIRLATMRAWLYSHARRRCVGDVGPGRLHGDPPPHSNGGSRTAP